MAFKPWILVDSPCPLFASSIFRFNIYFSYIQYSEEEEKIEGSVIQNEMQHIAVKTLEIKFDFGFKYECFLSSFS